MTKEIAPVFLTGGAGYGFEDQVAAWFLVHLLCGEGPVEAGFGILVSVGFQVRESGWLLDDLLITGKGEAGTERRLAVSVKRDRQVTQGGFRSDFVEAVWEQWLGFELPENPFQRDHDLLCLVTGQLADSVKSAWDAILQQAMVTTPARLAERLTHQHSSNEIQRALFASLRCPQTLAQVVAETDDSDTAEVLSHLRLLHYDFPSSSSKEKQAAIRMCQSCLRQGSLVEAVALWDDIVAIASELRQRGGSVNLPQLLRRLPRYSFVEHPNYQADWNTLRNLSSEAMAVVRTRLGPDILVSREQITQEISGLLESSGRVILLGESGAGKSALAKSITSGGRYQRAVWLNGQHLEGQGQSTVSHLLTLTHSLTEILPSVGEERAILVLDAIENFSPQALRNAADLIHAVEPGATKSRWHVLITAQPLRWETVQVQLQMYGLELSQELIFSIQPPDLSILASVMQGLPDLRELVLRPQIGELLRNLKILDWVASKVSSNPEDGQDWAGLSDIIDSVWSWWTQGDDRRYVRVGVLRKISVEEAQSFSGVVSIDQLATADLEILADLENRRLLNVREGKVSFGHNLLGDWSRLQRLTSVERARLASELRNRAENPRWHAAIRLYGLRTLERAPDSGAWFELLHQLDDGSDLGQLAANLVLEAVAFASNAQHFLELTWPYLSADEGKLLKRLLRRFRHSATLPEPVFAVMASRSEVGVWLSSSMRVPIWPYWKPMLIFLHAHAHEVKKLALEATGEICHLWLSRVPARTKDGEPYPWRREAAEIALILAREVQSLQAKDIIVSDKERESAYKAFLSAASDLPEQVATLALELAKRRPAALEIQEVVAERQRQAEENRKRILEDPESRSEFYQGLIPSLLGPLREPWPAGPTESIDQVFRDVCLEKQALGQLMATRAATAKEIALALCIEPPQHKGYERDPIAGMKYGTTWASAKPMYFAGPFFAFLQIKPETAIELIIELVDFATQRWQEWATEGDGISADPEVDEDQSVDLWIQGKKRQLVGDSRVLGWYRERLIDGPYVVSALMALEKWLYDRTDANEDISTWIDLILQEARSLAFVGVLIALGKKQPGLLLGCLKPILSIWQIYNWDWVVTQDDAAGLSRLSLMLWTRQGEEIFNVVRDWHAMPHREIYFRDLVTHLLLSDREFQQHFDSLRATWRTMLGSRGAALGSLEFLIERFDPANYHLEQHREGERVAVLEFPEHLREISEASMRDGAYSLELFAFPRKCRGLIDSGKQLVPEELERFWQTLRYLADEHEQRRKRIEYVDNAVMAGIAVLTVLHQEWLAADERKAAWCAGQIERIVESEHGQGAHDSPSSIYNLQWQIFLGEIAVHSLAEDPGDREARYLTAYSVFAYHYSTTETVCRAAFRLRAKLGDEFGRLLNLCRLWAGIRRGTEWRRLHQLETPILQRWYESVLGSFVDHTLQSEPIPLKEIANRSEKLIMEQIRDQRAETLDEASEISLQLPIGYLTDEEVPSRSHLGLDWEVIQAAYAWLPPLSEAANPRERAAWIAFCKELLQLELIYIHSAPRDRWDEVEGVPYEFEYWVFETIASLIPQLEANEHPEQFWRPILDLGASAHYWVDSFLSRWFISGSMQAKESITFAKCWKGMIEYVLESPLWRNNPSTPGHFRLEGLYIQLMGLGLGGATLAQEAYADIVSRMSPLYEKWAEEWLERARVAEAFANFLTKPAATALMLPGLTWLAQSISRIPERNWEQNGLPSTLLSLLVTCWQHHLPELESDTMIKKAFLDLLNALIAREHPGALELRDVILR